MASRLTNSMEHMVEGIVTRLHSQEGDREERCRCAACEADIKALALSSLPPHYFTNLDACDLLMGKEADRLEVVVESAAARVARNPKDGRDESPPGEVTIVNFTVEEGSTIIDGLASEDALPCSCDTCRTDILAYALNRYPAKYGVARDGRTALRRRDRENLQKDLAFFVKFAAGVVARNPRHS